MLNTETSVSPSANLQIERRGSYVAIRFNNPPVNALNNSIRRTLNETITSLIENQDVRGFMFTSTGATFVAGADIMELERGVQPPFLGDMLRLIELSGKPTLAAMRGPAVGGGLEIALACSYRIALPRVRLALPEITLGLLPGAGGTQRLTRCIGLSAALDLLLSGRMVSAAEALTIGLLDEIVDDDVDARGWAWLETQPGARRPLPPQDSGAIRAARERVASDPALRDLPAAQAILEVVGMAVEGDPGLGFARERALFLSCRETPQAQALLRTFVAKRRDSPPGTVSKRTGGNA